MATNNLEFIEPAGGEHAIAEVVFEVNLHPETRIIEPQRYIDSLKDELSEELPKYETTKAVFAEMNSNSMSVQQVPVAGFTFEKYKANGSLEYRLHAQNQPPGQGSWVAVNLMSYSNWSEMADKAINWMQLIAKIQPGLQVKGITLNFINQFNWNSKDLFPTNLVFNTSQSSYIPARLQDDLEDWSCQLSSAKTYEHFRQIENMNIALQTNVQNGFKRAQIAMPLSLEFLSPCSYDELFDGDELLGLYSKLHDDNKQILSDVLTDDICEMIALKKLR